jgi:integrase/recombinase XerD
VLGHESVEATQVYLHAHLALKEAALAKLKPLNGRATGRYRPGDRLLAFLDAL